MVFSTENLVLIKVLCHEKVTTLDELSHCFIGDNCECAWVRVVTETCVMNE